MCRMAAYQGPPISLEQFALRPEHSLVEQAYMPKELTYAKINADGYGFGWYADDDQPAVYTSAMPIWSDANLPHLARSLQSDLWMGNVRSATTGIPVNRSNTQPFYDNELLFLHNGYLREFKPELRRNIYEALSPEIEAEIQGNTDSEYVFALLRQVLSNDDELSIDQALGELFALLEQWVDDREALLNVIVSDGEMLYASRHAMNHACPSLYYTTDDELFPNGQLIASERLTDSEFWQPVPEHHILVLDPEEPPDLLSL